jgi:hypothetical protein
MSISKQLAVRHRRIETSAILVSNAVQQQIIEVITTGGPVAEKR